MHTHIHTHRDTHHGFIGPTVYIQFTYLCSLFGSTSTNPKIKVSTNYFGYFMKTPSNLYLVYNRIKIFIKCTASCWWYIIMESFWWVVHTYEHEIYLIIDDILHYVICEWLPSLAKMPGTPWILDWVPTLYL